LKGKKEKIECKVEIKGHGKKEREIQKTNLVSGLPY
jgi:hypothetical protein